MNFIYRRIRVEVTPIAELASEESGRQIYLPAAGYFYPQQEAKPYELESTINPHYYGPAMLPYYYPSYNYGYPPAVEPLPVPENQLQKNFITVTSTTTVVTTSTYTSVPPCSSSQTALSQCPSG